ncbi:Cohesin domain [Seminavis robusta]|uniref:Cohesin domain n=1 Tax=Seminavis robusta TaxID=568900 RepID=A0A9N8DV53_9STRA|nr:Cohesin domain [Seminavis robusta]|eukprot:Sro306_g112930.1 Cohesin domain (1097) ;mRNA; f:20512-24052
MLLALLALLMTQVAGQGAFNPGNQQTSDVIIVDGFVDTETCHDHLLQADAMGNNDGKLQADEFVEFAQLQAPSGQLDNIEDYQSMPLVMQATFVTLTCLCRDERFGGDSRDVNCCLGIDAHISIVGNEEGSTSQEKTRLFATCFLTDQAIVQVISSEPPSDSPTNPPTDAPTKMPTTGTPSTAPSALPTNSPSNSPTVSPSRTPTMAPTTAAPVVTPTTSPTTEAPTDVPTMMLTTQIPTSLAPIVSPTSSPIVTPTSNPPTSPPSSASPTTPVTPVPVYTQIANVVYTIAVANASITNVNSTVYEPDLINAMDQLASTVVTSVFVPERRRNLQVRLSLPTEVATYEVTNCTAGLAGDNDRCENVAHEITMIDTVELNPDEVADFETALLNAILRGELQANLPSDSIVKILTGMDPNVPIQVVGPSPSDAEVVDEGLSGGATAGIVLAALVLTIFPIALYLAMRQNNEEKEPYGAYEPHDAVSTDGIHPTADEHDVEVPTTPQKVQSIGGGVAATLGAAPSDYGKTSAYPPATKEPTPTGSIKQVHKVPPVSPERETPDQNSFDEGHSASSSNAGSSGWSSSAGLSSLNTGSAEDSMDMLNSPQGSSLAAIGAASAVARRVENRRNISPMSAGIQELDVPAGAVSRNDLDNAIEAGDWAAVGATAALLAAASDSQSASSKSRTSRNSRSQNTSVSSVDAQRAAELDHLVDAGDWEGVVLAAAKFEAQEGSIRSGTASSARSSSIGSEGTRSGTGSGTFTPSVSTSVSESASKAQKRDEIRQEVEALVRRVVPEELDNVNEMMLQFKGREEELVETLRTMQERAVAQKARTAGHKAAKQEARRTVQRGGIPGAAPPAPAPASSPAGQDASSSREAQSSSSDPSSDALTGSPPRNRTALEQAIEAGDWEAVGEAAALMSDTSLASASTAEVERRAASARLGAGSSSGATRSLRIGGVNADRARELDEMIDQGNWAAVVEAAGRFNQADKQASATSSVDYSPAKRSYGAGPDSEESTTQRKKQLKEEEDALAQAEIWMQIAQQSKSEGATDIGASAAADWAIARSLKSLKNAEEQDDRGSAGGSHQGSHQSGADDDESV